MKYYSYCRRFQVTHNYNDDHDHDSRCCHHHEGMLRVPEGDLRQSPLREGRKRSFRSVRGARQRHHLRLLQGRVSAADLQRGLHCSVRGLRAVCRALPGKPAVGKHPGRLVAGHVRMRSLCSGQRR